MASKRTSVKIAHASYRYVDPDGRERIALRGETVDIDPDAYDLHAPLGAFVEDEEPEAEAPHPDTVEGVLAEVGDDKEKAQAALDAENAKEKPRSTLVGQLEQILGQA